jgi:RND family efflux transporter MFP subunit
MTRRVLAFTATLALPAALVALVGCQKSGDAAGAKVTLPASAPAAVALGSQPPGGLNTPEPPADEGAALTGTTAARRVSQVSASGSGLLVDLKVREGDYVQAGQVIASLDRRDAALRIAQAEAGLKAAQVQLAGAEREVARLERLARDQAVPQADLDRLTSSRDAAAAGVEVAQAGLNLARKMAADADVRAPFAGLVTARLKAEGEWISTMPPAPLVLLAEVDPLELKVDVPAALLPRVAAGDTLTVDLVSIGRKQQATITRVVPEVSARTRAFTVYAELPNPNRTLAPGLFAEVRLGRGGARPATETAAPEARAPSAEPAGSKAQ